jgi:hypothetical protein
MHFRQEGGEVAPGTWLTFALTFAGVAAGKQYFPERLHPLSAEVLFGALVALAVLSAGGAIRQYFINVGQDRERAAAPKLAPQQATPAGVQEKLQAALPRPAPPSVTLVTCETNVPLMHRLGGGYRRVPADGELTYGLIAAFRHSQGSNASMTAHVRYAGHDRPDLHVHSCAWIGTENGSFTVGPSQTGELILAVHSHSATTTSSTWAIRRHTQDGAARDIRRRS